MTPLIGRRISNYKGKQRRLLLCFSIVRHLQPTLLVLNFRAFNLRLDLPQARVEAVSQPVAKEIKRHDNQEYRYSGEE